MPKIGAPNPTEKDAASIVPTLILPLVRSDLSLKQIVATAHPSRPEHRRQRCWMHKSGNVLDKLPKSVQPRAKDNLHQIWMSETKAGAEKAFRDTMLTMVFKLSMSAQKRWRKLNRPERLGELIEGVQFVDGIKQEKEAA